MTTSDPQPIASQNTSPPPSAIPPQQPGEIGGPEQAATWPKIIGVISIVFGSVACLSGAWGLLAPRLMEAVAVKAPQSQAAPFAAMEGWGTWIVVSSALTMLIAPVLLVAGIDLVRRRRRGIKLGRVWAVLKMIFAVAGSYLGFVMIQEQFRQMPQQKLPVGGDFFVVMGVVGAVAGVLWSCAYPVFLLIWFSRAKVRTEYTQWR